MRRQLRPLTCGACSQEVSTRFPVVTVATASSVYYDPYDVGINADPYPVFRRLRDEAPIYYNPRYHFWALSRHVDVERAFANWQTFSSSHGDVLEVVQSGMEIPSGMVVWEDPPVHAQHRGLLSRLFTPKRMSMLEEQVRAYCASCLDPLVGTDRFDFVKDLGREMPTRVIGMLLGVPESDQTVIRDRVDRMMKTDPGQPMAISRATAIRGDQFAEYIDWRVQHPSDDLMTALLTAEFVDETGHTRTLSRQEVLTYTQLVAGAGNETTGRLIGWLGKLLGDHPDQRRQVVENRSLIPSTVEETLRVEPPAPHVARFVTRDVEFYGTTVPAGSAMLLLVGSANRDQRRYIDPDRFDIQRRDSLHIAFGYGLHYCLGANLARLEGRVALDEVLKRFPDWEVDYDNIKLAPTSTVRGWETLPVHVG
jgi:cytochrome P450